MHNSPPDPLSYDAREGGDLSPSWKEGAGGVPEMIMKTADTKSDFLNLAGGVAKRFISPDSSVIAKALLQVLDLKNFSRELLDALLERAGKQKDIVIEAMVAEFSKYLSRLNLPELSRQIMEGLTIDVNATVHIRKKGSGHSLSELRISSGKTKNRKKAR